MKCFSVLKLLKILLNRFFLSSEKPNNLSKHRRKLNPLNQNFVNLEAKFLCWRDKYIEYLYFSTKIRIRRGPGTRDLMLLEVLSCDNQPICDDAILSVDLRTIQGHLFIYIICIEKIRNCVSPWMSLNHSTTKFSLRNSPPFRFPLRVFAWRVCGIIPPRVAS